MNFSFKRLTHLVPYILVDRSRPRIGRTISFVLKKFNLDDRSRPRIGRTISFVLKKFNLDDSHTSCPENLGI